MNEVSSEAKETILKRYAAGEKVVDLAREFNVSRSTIYLWLKKSQDNILKDHSFTAKEFKSLQQKCERLEKIVRILQESPYMRNYPPKDKLSYLEQLYKNGNSVHLICDAMGVPRGTFYNHVLRGKHGHTKAAQRRAEMLPIIDKIFNDSHQIYGAGKIAAVLKSKGYAITESFVRKTMQENDLYSMRSRSKKIYAKHRSRSQNILNRDFTASCPNEKWVSDVTYFHLKNKCYYICVILDLFSRKVISYAISNKNSTQLTKSTFIRACTERLPDEGLIFHSDNGSNYISKSFMKCLKEHNVIQSFSEAGVPYDNSVCEAFFKNMKAEELYHIDYSSEKHFKIAVDKYIRKYNQERPLSVIGYLTPDKFEEEYYKKNGQKGSDN